MSGGRRGGERRQHARIKRMHHAQAREIVASDEGTRPSLGPSTRARRSSLCSGAQASEVRRRSEHHGWANRGNPEEPTLGLGQTDVARLAAGHRSRKGGSVVGRRKGRESWFPSLRGSRVVGSVARTSNAVAEVDRRRLTSNKLGKRAPKRAAGSSERGSSSERRPVGETAGRRFE